MFPLLPFFFFNDTAPTEIYTLSLHNALPILGARPYLPIPIANLPTQRFQQVTIARRRGLANRGLDGELSLPAGTRSEEHTSELQSPDHLVCRLLLEKKKKTY